MSAVRKLNTANATSLNENAKTSPFELKLFNWNQRILVVEDEPAIAALYKDILQPEAGSDIKSSRVQPTQNLNKSQSSQFELVIVHSAAEAMFEVKKAVDHKRPFAMGFFDVMLGQGADGFELVKEIQEIMPEMYSVFVTAYNDRSVDSIHSYLGEDKADRWDYLNKPFSKSEIKQKARNFVSLWNLKNEKKIKDEELAELYGRLIENERMSSVAAVARGVGHEFGNILMQIMGKADIALGKDEAGMSEALETIIKASSKASEILDRFKDLSSAKKADHPPQMSFSVNEVVNEALQLMEHHFKVNKTKVCRIKNDKVSIPLNPTTLTQVFVNLAINAVHAMGVSGQVDLSITDLGDYVEIRFRDYGPGIERNILGKVTDAFFTTKGSAGTGLGLSICKEIIEVEHEGEFRVANHAVKGLEVEIRLNKSNSATSRSAEE